jgi:hypothetical protein
MPTTAVTFAVSVESKLSPGQQREDIQVVGTANADPCPELGLHQAEPSPL